MIAEFVDLPDHSLIDLGCGNGRLGLWLADAIRCHSYIGIDRDPRCIVAAERATKPSALRTRFETLEFGELEGLGIQCGAAMAHDSLYLTSSPASALRAAASLLLPRSVLLFTAYVGETEEGGVAGRSEAFWLEATAAAGFGQVTVTDISDAWRYWGRRVHAERLRLSSRLVDELGALDGARLLSISRRMLGLDGRPGFLQQVHRIRICGRRI